MRNRDRTKVLQSDVDALPTVWQEAVIGITLGAFDIVKSGYDAAGIAILIFEVMGIASVFVYQLRSSRERESAPGSYRNPIRSDSADS